MAAYQILNLGDGFRRRLEQLVEVREDVFGVVSREPPIYHVETTNDIFFSTRQLWLDLSFFTFARPHAHMACARDELTSLQRGLE